MVAWSMCLPEWTVISYSGCEPLALGMYDNQDNAKKSATQGSAHDSNVGLRGQANSLFIKFSSLFRQMFFLVADGEVSQIICDLTLT